MSWHSPEQAEYGRLEDFLDQNRPLTELFRAWPFWHYVIEDRWPDLLKLLGVEYDPARVWPYWVDFEGALIFRLPRSFLGDMPPQELYVAEQPIFVPDPRDKRFKRPMLPQEAHEDAVYITSGRVTVHPPGTWRPERLPFPSQ